MLREKRWILFCLLFAFTGLFAAPTQAAENTDPVYQGMKYRLDAATEEITITGYTADVAWNLEIPLEIDGKKVTAIAKYAFSESRIRSVTLNENMISIGAGAFYQCKDLEQVKMADSITTIGEMAFFECPNLYSIRIPGGVKEIGYDAFKNCERLSYVTIETGVQTISHCVFSGCSSLEEIAIPDSVTSIGARAFENCTKLKKVDMPDQVTVIGTDKEVCDKAHWGPLASYDPNAYKNASKNEGGTFQGCSALTEIHLPKNLETIHINTFKDCSALKTITIPGSVKTIEEYAFQGCRGLLELTISDGVDKIDIYAFKDCTSLTKVEIPDSVTAMGSSREVSMPIGGSVKPPDKDMGGIFEGCTALASIRLSKNAEYIYPNTFTGCLNLNHVEIPDGVKTIGTEAFKDCRNLAEITLPDSLTLIDTYAFAGCISLADLEIPDSVTAIGSVKTVVKEIPGGIVSYRLVEEDQGGSFSGCTALANIRLSKNVEYIYPNTFTGCISLNHVEIPDGVKTIGTEAFKDCRNLADLEIPDSVTAIGSAKTVVKKIPGLLSFYDLVEEDQGGSFSGCTALANIRLPQSLTKIYPATFENCSGLNHIVLPPKVTSVGDGAFSGCTGLTSIYIPPSVTSLDLDASGLGQSVQNIYGEKGSYAETLATGSSCSFKEEVYCTFDANGGTVGEKKRLVLPGDLYRELPVPVKGNDKFLGWYTAANGGENVTANTKVTSEQSHTLYARWETAGTSGETQTPGGNDGAESGTKNPPGENPETKDNETSGGNSGNNGTSGGSGSNGTSGSSGSSGDGTDTPAGGSQKQAQTITASSKTAAYKSKPFSLKATAGGGGKLTYKSSNTKVAAVSSTGKVTVKNYGQATITIKAAAKGNYLAATKKITVKVVPKTPALKKVGSSGKKKISASWGKDKTADGYQMYISLQKDFKKGTYERTYKKSAGSMALTGLKSKKTYYIKLRSYKKVGKKKYYSAWSKVKNVKVK